MASFFSAFSSEAENVEGHEEAAALTKLKLTGQAQKKWTGQADNFVNL